MHDDHAPAAQAGYLLRVLLGLGLLALEVSVALGLPDTTLSPTLRQGVIAALVLTCLLQVQLIHWLYGRADELRQAVHRQACAHTLAWLMAGCGVAGVLQANGVIPVVNQFWTLGALVVLWGVQLMLADRPYH